MNSHTKKYSKVWGRDVKLPMPYRHAIIPAPPCVHQTGSSPNSIFGINKKRNRSLPYGPTNSLLQYSFPSPEQTILCQNLILQTNIYYRSGRVRRKSILELFFSDIVSCISPISFLVLHLGMSIIDRMRSFHIRLGDMSRGLDLT